MNGYQPGYTVEYNAHGQLIDKCASIAERMVDLGEVWRMGTGYQSLSGAAVKLFLSFKTPVTGHSHYMFSTLQKTGGEIVFTLNEGGVLTNGTTNTAYNLNRDTATACPLTAMKYGLSTDGSPVSLAGGVNAPPNMMPGASVAAASRPGGTSSGAPFIHLKNDTVYTLVCEAKDVATMTAFVDIAVSPA